MTVPSKVIVLDPDARSGRQLRLGFEREGVPTAAMDPDKPELTEPPDLVVVGGADGQGLELVRKARALLEIGGYDAPIVFAGSHARPTELEAAGADEVVLRPAFLRDVVTIGRILRGKPADHRAHIVGSLAETTGVFNLVRALSALGRSAVLTLIRGLRRGEVRFYHGEVTSAQVGLIHGQAALHQLLLWTDARFDFHHEDVVRRQQIPLAPEELFADAERFLAGVRDESGRLSPSMVLEQDVARIHALGKQIPTEVHGVLRMFDGHRVLADILEDSPYRVFETLRVTQRAVEAGLLRPTETKRAKASWRAVLAIEEWLVGSETRDAVVERTAAIEADKEKEKEKEKEPPKQKQSKRTRKKRRLNTPISLQTPKMEIDWGALVPRTVGAEVGPLAGVVPAAQASGEIPSRDAPRERLEALMDTQAREKIFAAEVSTEPKIIFNEAEELRLGEEQKRAKAEEKLAADTAAAEKLAAEQAAAEKIAADKLAAEQAAAEKIAADKLAAEQAAAAEKAAAEALAAQRAADDKLAAEKLIAAERAAAEAAAAQAEAEAKAAAEAKRVAEEDARVKAEAKERRQRAEARAKSEAEKEAAEQAAKLAAEAQARADAERVAAAERAAAEAALAKAEALAQEAEARAKAEEARLAAEVEARAKAEEARLAAEVEARAKTEADERAERLRREAVERQDAGDRARDESESWSTAFAKAEAGILDDSAHVAAVMAIGDSVTTTPFIRPDPIEIKTPAVTVTETAGAKVTIHDALSVQHRRDVAHVTATPVATVTERSGGAAAPETPEAIDDEPSDGVVRQMTTAETAPARRAPPGHIPDDDRPKETGGEIAPRATHEPTVDQGPSILIDDLAAAQAAISSVVAQAGPAPTANAATPAAETAVAAVRKDAAAFSAEEQAFFRQHETGAIPRQSLDDIDSDPYEKPVGFWDRLLGRKPPKK